MRVLGIEGTAWAASAAIYDTADGSVIMETEPFQPAHGGIDPSEAAVHMETALPSVIASVLRDATAPFDAVAFSQGPGLGPCLRLTATVARTVATHLDLPLIGVNHMVAHAEVGRQLGDLHDPIALNASGANAHVLGFRDGRYRVLGETMDTGVGNAIDKFTRHLGWRHPGGPKVERYAQEGSYVELPYVVKGMDFSFSGITSAAKALVDDGTPAEDVCCGLQETIFAMLTEVAERALSLTHRDELVLGGGVGRNARLQEMLRSMTAERGATLFVPPQQYLGDNAGMIAIAGASMARVDQRISLDESAVIPDYRPEAVPIRWRDEPVRTRSTDDSIERGAEAVVEFGSDDTVEKIRRSKPYRHPELDANIRTRRTVQEARLLQVARSCGVPTPVVLDVDPDGSRLRLTHVGTADLRDALTPERVEIVGTHLAHLHVDAGYVHGDSTVRNVRVDDNRVYLIDFGLGFRTDDIEDQAMDLHVFLQSLQDIVTDRTPHRDRLLTGYTAVGSSAVVERLAEIEARGRYR